MQQPLNVLAMTIGQVAERDDRLFKALRQLKTDVLVDVPVHARLEPLIRERLSAP